MTDKKDQTEQSPSLALVQAIGGDEMDFIASAADVGLDSLISSGVLDGVPFFGLIRGAAKGIGEFRDRLYLKKVCGILAVVGSTTKQQRAEFIKRLDTTGELKRFGETVLFIAEKIDDARKPLIIGRIISAHIKGQIPSYSKAMRLVSIINRVYGEDLEYLRSFQPGVPQDADVAAALFSAGLLANTGFDGGGADQALNPGGITYCLNDFAALLLKYGLN